MSTLFPVNVLREEILTICVNESFRLDYTKMRAISIDTRSHSTNI